jgi:hypothetical protein
MKVPRRKFFHLAVGATALALDYPTRPVRIVVGFPAGGPTDIFARLMGQWLSQRPISASSSSTTHRNGPRSCTGPISKRSEPPTFHKAVSPLWRSATSGKRQKATFKHVQVMSALPPKADMGQRDRDVRFVPKAEAAWPSGPKSRGQAVEQGFSFFKIAGVEAFNEPEIDRSEEFASLILFTLTAPQPRHTHRRTQLPRLGLLFSRNGERSLKIRFRFGSIRFRCQ